MLQIVQQFERDGLQIEEHRPKSCTFYNIEPPMRFISPFLLYKIQHWADSLENSALSAR